MPHASDQVPTRSLNQEVMIRDEHPCVTGRCKSREGVCQTIKEILSIPVIYEYLSTLYPPDHDVVQDAGCPSASVLAQAGIQASLSATNIGGQVLAWHIIATKLNTSTT